MYKLEFNPGWDVHYAKMDNSEKERIWKKIQKQKEETQTMHLKFGLEFYAIEAGQYRIAIKINESEKTKIIWFAGNHKQYEEWYKKARQTEY